MQDLAGLAAELRSFALGAEALLDRCLARIAGRDPALNSIVALDLDTARQAARDSDARLRAGAPLSPLDGIPLTVKDSILVRGMPATWGSRAFKDLVPAQDELPVARLRAAGAVILGKTNVPELTLEGYTANTLFGVTRNPWNPALTPGGSSGGAAASVAAGMVPAAIGTDGGGSIRRPASHTGLLGFKPSIGRYPRIDGFPAILTDFETIGLLTRTVADAVLLDAVLAGPDARDRRSLFAGAAPWPARPRRILYVPRFGASPVDAEVSAATAQVAAALAGAGHDVREADVFFDTEDAGRIWHVVSRSGVAWLRPLVRQNGAIREPARLVCKLPIQGEHPLGILRPLRREIRQISSVVCHSIGEWGGDDIGGAVVDERSRQGGKVDCRCERHRRKGVEIHCSRCPLPLLGPLSRYCGHRG